MTDICSNLSFRQLLLPELSVKSQLKMKCSRGVLIVGAGGLGCPAAMYLAAAGVARIGIVDHDVVVLSNLNRQVKQKTLMTSLWLKCIISTYWKIGSWWGITTKLLILSNSVVGSEVWDCFMEMHVASKERGPVPHLGPGLRGPHPETLPSHPIINEGYYISYTIFDLNHQLENKDKGYPFDIWTLIKRIKYL